MKRARTFPEERADRSKGIRGAEDGQSGSGASSPRDLERREGVRERGRKGKEQQEGGNTGGRRERLLDGGGGDRERKRDKFIVFWQESFSDGNVNGTKIYKRRNFISKYN